MTTGGTRSRSRQSPTPILLPSIPATSTAPAALHPTMSVASPASNCASTPSPIPSTSSIANSNAGTGDLSNPHMPLKTKSNPDEKARQTRCSRQGWLREKPLRCAALRQHGFVVKPQEDRAFEARTRPAAQDQKALCRRRQRSRRPEPGDSNSASQYSTLSSVIQLGNRFGRVALLEPSVKRREAATSIRASFSRARTKLRIPKLSGLFTSVSAHTLVDCLPDSVEQHDPPSRCLDTAADKQHIRPHAFDL